MDVEKAIRVRRSVREYTSQPVEEEKLNAVLEAAMLAPSASNRQEWRFIVVRDASSRAMLSEAAKGQGFVAQAPVVIACCAETDEHVMACGEKSYPIDVAIAIDHMTLRAAELDLGTCWVGAFNYGRIKDILGIPWDIKVVQLLTLGYPRESLEEKPKNRFPENKLVHYEKWGGIQH